VVGHASQHADALLAQLEETFANFDALLGAARQSQATLPASFGAGTRLKVYVRDRGDLDAVDAALQARFGDRVRASSCTRRSAGANCAWRSTASTANSATATSNQRKRRRPVGVISVVWGIVAMLWMLLAWCRCWVGATGS
jgi:enamine deaminase RidA (YjgF/YER057c/UK114 family)